MPLDVDGVPLAKDVDGEPLADEEEEDIFNMSPKKSFVSLKAVEISIVFAYYFELLQGFVSRSILCAVVVFKRSVHFLE